MLVLGDLVSNSTRQNILRDMIAGGERRARWAHSEGDKALEVIESQRTLAHMVIRHQNTLRRRSSILLRPLDITDRKAPVLTSGHASGRALTPTRQSTLARLAAAETHKGNMAINPYRLRHRRFRKVLH